MRATAGASRDARGYAGLMVVFAVAGLVIAGVMLAPNLILPVQARLRTRELGNLERVRDELVRAIVRTQSIPAATNWSTFLLPFAPRDLAAVQTVYPGFSSDTNAVRVFLVDPNLTSGLLPYAQGSMGLMDAQTNLLGTNARVLLVSNTRRGLALPVSSGIPSSAMFNSLWNWVYDPTTKSPPTAFPAGWSGFGEFLQVQPVHLADLFYRISLAHLLYNVGEGTTATNLVSTQTTFCFLQGTRLVLADVSGTLERIHVVTRDASFDFGTNSGPMAWFSFVETSGTVVTNSGSLGPSANGTYTNGPLLNAVGPRAPAYAGYASNNTAVTFDGADDYINGTNNLMNGFTGFTIAGWIKPTAASFDGQDIFGQLDLAGFGFTTAGKLELHCDNDTKKLHYFYPYAAGEWHHIAGVGDGANMYIYVDGVQVATRTFAAVTYGSNGNPFNIGAKVFSAGNYFQGSIDEVLVYDHALSASQIAQIYTGSPP